jgi:hypothetical protein
MYFFGSIQLNFYYKKSLGFRVFGFRVLGFRVRVQGSGFPVRGSGFGSGFMVYILVKGFGFRVLEFRV